MRFEDFEREAAFRSLNGECGWTRAQANRVIAILRSQSFAILGGELWLVRTGSRDWTGLIPQQNGPDAIYTWETERDPQEDWASFVTRCAANSMAAVEKWPDADRVSPNIDGQILYNFTWVSEKEM